MSEGNPFRRILLIDYEALQVTARLVRMMRVESGTGATPTIGPTASQIHYISNACSTDYRPRPICPPGENQRWQAILAMNRDQLRALRRQPRPAWEITLARRIIEK